MAILKMKFADGTISKVSDMSFDEFEKLVVINDSSSVLFEGHKRHNGIIDITHSNIEKISEITMVVEHEFRGDVLNFNCVYDPNKGEFINSNPKVNKMNQEEDFFHK